MKFASVLLVLAIVVHVKCQLDVNVEDIIYGEEDEEDDEEGATTSTTARPRRRRSTTTTTTTTTPLPSTVIVPLAVINGTNATLAAQQNHTFIIKPANNTIFGSIVTSSAAAGASTERAHYVLGQVGNIWNNVGKLNVTGIVDQALGIRNSQFARPLVTGILNAVFCNPITFSNNNCQKRG